MRSGFNTTGFTTYSDPHATGCKIKEIIEEVEVPVAAFPLRGKCNPYFSFLFPLIVFRILILLSLIGALTSVILVPKIKNNFESETPATIKDCRIAAIIIFSVTMAFTIILIIIELLNLCNIADSKFVSVIISFFDLMMALLIIGISIPLIAFEVQASENKDLYVNAIEPNTLLISGIFGTVVVLFLLINLFFSRFYQFCIGNYKSFKREFMSGSMPYTKRNKNLCSPSGVMSI